MMGNLFLIFLCIVGILLCLIIFLSMLSLNKAHDAYFEMLGSYELRGLGDIKRD